MANIIVIGNVTEDLELKTSKNGNAFLNFSLAENNKDSNSSQETTYYKCTLFVDMAKRIVNAKVKKGSCLQVVGRYKLSFYEKKDGTTGHSQNIFISDWSHTPTAKKSESSKETYNETNTSDNSNQDFSESYANDKDDDLPF